MRELTQNLTESISNTTDVKVNASSQSSTNEFESSQPSADSTTASSTPNHNRSAEILYNPRVLYRKEEKRLACIPCGHLVTCVPCGQPLRSCPICGRQLTNLSEFIFNEDLAHFHQ